MNGRNNCLQHQESATRDNPFMNVKFVNPVVNSIINVLSAMTGLQPQLGEKSIKQDNVALGAVTGMIEYKGSQAAVSTAISFPAPVALEIAHRLLHIDVDEINDIVKDLVGEMANMMAGGAKGVLEAEGYDLEMNLPSVFDGDGHEVPHTVNAPVVLLHFTTDIGDFYVEIAYSEVEQPVNVEQGVAT